MPWLIRTATYQCGVACLFLQSPPTFCAGVSLGTSIWQARQETKVVGFGRETSQGDPELAFALCMGGPWRDACDHHASVGCPSSASYVRVLV